MQQVNQSILKKDIIKKLQQSEKEIEEKKGIDVDKAFEELKQKYGYGGI